MSNISEVMTELQHRRESGEPGNHKAIWVRPVSWRGTGRALDYNLETHRLEMVPFPSGLAYAPYLAALIGDWELVGTSVVLSEGKEL